MVQFYCRIYWHRQMFEFKEWGANGWGAKCGDAKWVNPMVQSGAKSSEWEGVEIMGAPTDAGQFII